MLRKIVAGNTIYIKWTVRKNDSILKDNLSVKLYDVFRKECAITYEIEESEDNKNFIINITYPGNKQFTFGKYSVVLFNNVDDVKQNKLVFKDVFILVHALKNRIICYGDELVDDSVLIEIDSDLNIALQNQEIQDKTQILGLIETLDSSVQDLKDELDNIQDRIDFSYINSSINNLNSSFNYLKDDVSEIQGSLDIVWEKLDYFTDIDSSINILDNSVNYLIDDIGETEKTLVEYFTIIDNSVNMLMNTSMNSDYDDSSLTNYINNVSTRLNSLNTSISNVSTRVNNLSTNQDQLVTYIQNNRKHIIENENNISEISTVKIPTINTSINDLSTFMARLDASLQILWNSSQN